MKYLKQALCQFLKKGPHYSWKKVGVVLLFSIFICTGLPWGSYFLLDWIKMSQMKNSKYFIQAILQTGPEYDKVPTAFFAEVLGLSCDKPMHMHEFNCEYAKESLLTTHVFKTLDIKKIAPHTILIDYTVREPIARLGNFKDTYLDEEGLFFPHMPFHSYRKLPLIWLKDVEVPWGKKMDEKPFFYLLHMLSCLSADKIEEIDFSRIHAESAGKREIVLKMREGQLIRLTPKNCIQELEKYFILEKTLTEKGLAPSKIDLRLNGVAYINAR